MSFSVNKITLLGTLGRHAETRFTTNNVAITSFSLATEHSYKAGEDWKSETTWHNITAFKLSDYVKNNLTKGSKVYVEGRLQKREYTDKDGNKKQSVDVVAERIIPLSKTEKPEDMYSEDKTEPVDSTVEDDDSLPF